MVPLVAMAGEVALARSWVDQELAAAGAAGAGDARSDLPVGAMIETPRAALVAGALAREADFLSFGTNDLTQLTFGLSRDDAGRVLDAYRANGLLMSRSLRHPRPRGGGGADPPGRRRGPGGHAPEHLRWGCAASTAAIPTSIAQFVAAGLDSVSCSPFRVPVARLAAAQATTASGGPAPSS